VSTWPTIEEPELLDRLAMGDREFAQYTRALAAAIPPRGCDADAVERALGYPWERPPGSYLLTGAEVELLADMSAAERRRVIERFASTAGGRSPLLAIGSNAAPATLERKFAHFEAEDDRAVLALTGRLHDFDVGAAAQPTLYGSMPATLFPSPGTGVCATVLWITPDQFTQLTWSEISYRLGRLRTRFEVDDEDAGFGEVLAFVSRFGAFCVGGAPVAMAAVPASGRTAEALTQERLLDAAAALAIGSEATAETLVRAVFADMAAITAKVETTVRRASLPFASERWTPFVPAQAR
jgi:hypothetical protein